MLYQLVIIGPGVSRQAGVVDAVRQGFQDLGLDPDTDLGVLDEDQRGAIDWKGTPIGVWFGGKDRNPSPALASLMNNKCSVLPLVENLDHFQELVPDPLCPINGRRWDDDKIPGDILRMFRLTRNLRQAFISYRRMDSTPVAHALYDALSRRGYHVFLDTASVEAAVKFQDILWDRLADMDFLILLDSPNCLTSRWVLEELTQANQLGLGVLQLVWPGRRGDYEQNWGTHFSTPHFLQDTEFRDGNHDSQGVLTDQAIQTILSLAESVRIRSLGARRRRVTDEIVNRAAEVGLFAGVQAAGPVTIQAKQGIRSDEVPLLGLALPSVGLPDAQTIHELEKDLMKFAQMPPYPFDRQLPGLVGSRDVRVLYDGLGVETGRAEHYIWLNEQLKLLTMHFNRPDERADDPLQTWLCDLQERGRA